MLLYFIVIVLFSLMIGVLGLGNPHIVDGDFRKAYYQAEHKFDKSLVETKDITNWDEW